MIRPVNALAQECFAVFQEQAPHVIGIHVEHIEEVEIDGMLLHPDHRLTSVFESVQSIGSSRTIMEAG